MHSCPRSVRPGDTGAPPAQPSEAMPPAPGLAAIATPDRATTLRSWGLLMGSVRGSAGHPAAAVAAGRHRAMFQVPPQHPKTRRESLLPCSRNLPLHLENALGLSWAPLQGSEFLSKAGRDAEPQTGDIQPQSGGARPPASPQSLGVSHPSVAPLNACKGPA